MPLEHENIKFPYLKLEKYAVILAIAAAFTLLEKQGKISSQNTFREKLNKFFEEFAGKLRREN